MRISDWSSDVCSSDLAATFSRYLVYRPDWLQAWEAGKSNYASASSNPPMRVLETQLLAPLWRRVVEKLGTHRGQATAELHAALLADDGARPALHVFGVSHLAASEMQVIRAYARRAMVALYVPDPCRTSWGGLRSEEGRVGEEWVCTYRTRWSPVHLT